MLDLKESVNDDDAPKREGILKKLGMEPDDREVWRTHQIVDGRWRLINQVGFGAFGKVYDAIDLTTGDQVAVKVFNERFENSGYLQELGLLFGRSHPNVVEVYSFGYNRGHKYLVYEYVAGGSLRDYIVRYRKVDTEVAVDIALQIARGLDFAHTNEIVHRDLKPENILLSRSDIPFEIKICDFGLAARCSPEDRMASSFGTTAYMAPEQFKENYDSRVDIYAIGVMLYEMLFGRRPIKGDAVSVVYAHENLEIILPEGGPQKLRDLLSKTLSKSPDDRYQSAKELSEALLELQVELDQPESGPVLVRPPRRQQPELRQRWETVIPFSGRRFSVTECGQLSFVGRGRIITVERGGKFRQIFRVKDEPEQIVENGRMQGAFGWLHGDEIHMWRPDESSVVIDLPSELEKKPLNLIFGPNQDNLLVVSTEHIYLYNKIGELKWRADISTYGMVPTACFSRCGQFIWVATEAPRTQLICVAIDGECRSRTYAPHHEVALLGHHNGSVIVGEKNRNQVSIVDPDGFSQKTVTLHEPVYSLTQLDEDTVIVNSISHLEFLAVDDLRSVGFIDNSNPMDLAFAAKGGFFQVCLMEEKTKICFAEFI